MKTLKPKELLLFLFIFTLSNLNAQIKTNLGLEVIEDFSSVMSGGIEKGQTLMGLFALTHETTLWNGAIWKSQHIMNHGKGLTNSVGDLQTVSNIEAPRNIYLYEFYIEQTFKENRVIVGKTEINSLFAFTSSGVNFIHSSFGISPEMSVNVPLATFPYAAMGIFTDFKLHNNIHFSTAVFDGAPNTDLGYFNSYDFSINRKRGLFLIGEINYKNQKNTLPFSNIKLGFWNLKSSKQNESGFYALVDQVLFREKKSTEQGLNAFLQYGQIPNNPSVFSKYQGLGLVYKGAFKKRKKDEIGFAYGQGEISDIYKKNLTFSSDSFEAVIETYYNFVLNNQLEIQLDTQYIMNPGVNKNINNALIGFLRIKYSLI